MRRTSNAEELFARKLMKPFSDFTQVEIQNELRAVTKLCRGNPRHLVGVHGQGQLQDSPYYFIDMELCDINLEEYIYGRQALHDPCDTRKIWSIMAQITDGLTFIHNQNEVHRDLKPTNSFIFPGSFLILVLYSSEQDAWKIADFGFSTDRSSKTTMLTEQGRGTTSYRAPELLAMVPTFNDRVDIWALGCILFELAIKKRAFIADWHVSQHAQQGLKLSIELPDSIELANRTLLTNIVREMLRINSNKRPCASELRESFHLLSERGTSSAFTVQGDYFLSKICHPLSSDEPDEPESDIENVGLPYVLFDLFF